ncbi:MAG: hypothetical protein IJT62_07250 [Oscillospiraceae bacterium]|nr:hypothetical protein [Oscillospiraceae bacterium]
MNVAVKTQLSELLTALVLGLSGGAAYALLRGFFSCLSGYRGWMADLFFLVLFGCAVFAVGLLTGAGLRPFFLLASFGGLFFAAGALTALFKHFFQK